MTSVLLKIGIIVFAVESLIMFGFSIFSSADSDIGETLIDAVSLILISSPLSYLSAIKPYVTAYQKAEQERLETQQKLMTTIESINDGFVIYNVDDRLVLCIQKYREFYTDSADLIIPGAKFEDIIRTGAERGQYAQAIRRVDEGLAGRMEQHREADRSVEQLDDNRWLRMSERRMSDGGIAGIRVDIPELKQIQADLEKTRKELEQRVEERTSDLSATRNKLLQAVQIARLGHWRYDEVADVYLEVSAEYARIFGYTVEAFMKYHGTLKKNMQMTHPEDLEMLRRAYDSGKDQQLDYRILRSDGEVLYVRETIKYILDEGGDAIESVGTLQDITELKQSQLKAEAANLAKSRFLTTMSHELRTPLNAILGYSDLLVMEVAEAEQQSMLPDLDRINLFGRHLLDLSKIEAGRMKLVIEPIDVGVLVREVVAAVQPLIQKNDTLFELESDKKFGSLLADQSLLNLLSNASKFTENGRVALTVQKQCEDSVDWIIFSVSDSGIGIPGDHLDQVFEPFRQVDDSSTRSYEGSGLGLSISKRLCELIV